MLRRRPRLPALAGAIVAGTFLGGAPAPTPAGAQSRPADLPAAIAEIRQADLRRDLSALAADGMRGREAGTPDELRASAWIADRLREIGVEPLGQDGTYYQWFAMVRTRVSTAATRVAIGSEALVPFRDVIPATAVIADADGPVVWLDDPADTTTDVSGRIVALRLQTPARVRPTGFTPDIRYVRAAIGEAQGRLMRRRPAAIVLVADAATDAAFDNYATMMIRGSYDVDQVVPWLGGAEPRPIAPVPARPNGPVPVLLVRASREGSLRTGAPLAMQLRLERFETPSVNIVGVIRGTDPALANEYVLFSSHQDHDGVRYVVDGDSVWAGADDNGTASVSLLAAARAFTRQPAKRPILFVYHGAEERGLLGSRYHATHPVVPREQIIAVLNGEMMGRNHPDTASLLGIEPPHRNSEALVAMALRANEATGRFVLDRAWDRPDHPEGWYFRSDHLPYARVGIPSVMFTTNLHPDYHTPRDTPDRIDYPKLTRMAQWLYLTGWYVANAPTRPGLDAAFKLER